MNSPIFARRFYLHFIRYKTIVAISMVFVFVMAITFALIYPGEQATLAYVDVIKMIFRDVEVTNPGYSFWVALGSIMLLQMYLSIFGIFLGANILPWKDKEGKEFLLTTPKSTWKYYLENSVLVIGLMIAIVAPGFITTIVFLALNNATDWFLNIAIIYGIAVTIAVVFAFLSSFGSSLTFSKTSGYLLAIAYLVYSFFADKVPGTEDLKFLSDLSLIAQSEIFKNGIEATIPLDFIFLSITIVLFLIVGSLIFLYRNDFLESRSPQKIEEKIDQEEVGVEPEYKERLSLIRTPVQKLISALGWRYPAIRDQVHSNAGLLAVYGVFMAFVTFYILFMFSATTEGELASIIIPMMANPVLKAVLFNHPVDASLESFLTYEIFGFAWLMYGPYILIVTLNLVGRDLKDDYGEFTWTLPKSPSEVFAKRTLVAVINYIIIFALSYLILLIFQAAFGLQTDFMTVFQAFFALTWAYCVFLVFFVSITLSFHFKDGQKILILGYFVFVLMVIVAFISGITWLRYLTPFGYFDLAGIMLGELTLLDIAFPGLFLTVLSLVLFFAVIKFRIPEKDMDIA